MGNFVGEIAEGLRERVRNREEDTFFDGYDKAADICLTVIDEKISELYEKIDNGELLSNQEQYFMSQLNKLKKKIEDRLRNQMI